MKLTVENFRCYKHRVFTFTPNSITLITGPSGQGKTSIFKAINFVLYGKEQKTTSFGAKKSKVVLEFPLPGEQTSTITRTRCPNHLTVSHSGTVTLLEDLAAQAWINEHFGAHFLQTSYLTQKCLENFFTQSKDARADLLRTLSIQSYDIESLKSKNKEQVKERKAVMQTAAQELEFVKKEISARNLTEVLEPVCPLVVASGSSTEDAIIEHQRQLVYNTKKLGALHVDLKDLNHTLQTSLARSTNRVAYEQQLKELAEQISWLKGQCAEPVVVSEESVMRCKRVVKSHEIGVKLLEKQAVLATKKAESKVKEETELAYIQAKIEALVIPAESSESSGESRIAFLVKAQQAYEAVKRVWGGGLPAQSFKSTVKAWKPSPTSVVDLGHKREELSNFRKQCVDTTGTTGGIGSVCPHCSGGLAYICNRIVKYDDAVMSATLKTLTTEYVVLQEEHKKAKAEEQKQMELAVVINQYNEWLVENVEGLAAELAQVRGDVKTSQAMREQMFSLVQQKQGVGKKEQSLIRFLEEEVERLQKEATTTATLSVDPYADLRKAEEDLATCRVARAQQQQHSVQLVQSEQKKVGLEELLKLCEGDNLDAQRAKIQECNEQIEQRRKKAESFEVRKTAIEKWRVDVQTFQEWVRLSTKQDRIRAKLVIGERALKCALNASKLINDTESQLLQAFLEQLNEECARHMEVMFEGSTTMKVEYENSVASSEASEDKKMFVNVKLWRNGEEILYDTLSGGESDRCALVLFLAFNKLSKAKMLLLDECLSSLHAESVEDIVEHIKEEFRDRVCLMTLHQTTTGIFDQVVSL